VGRTEGLGLGKLNTFEFDAQIIFSFHCECFHRDRRLSPVRCFTIVTTEDSKAVDPRRTRQAGLWADSNDGLFSWEL